MIADEGEGAKHWARWRGPSGQGLSPAPAIPTRGPPPRTSVEDARAAGDGNSSPIVWGDRIFVTTAYDGGRGCRCWRIAAPTAEAVGDVRAEGRTDRPGNHYKNGHASATPATDGQRVYVSFGARGLWRST